MPPPGLCPPGLLLQCSQPWTRCSVALQWSSHKHPILVEYKRCMTICAWASCHPALVVPAQSLRAAACWAVAWGHCRSTRQQQTQPHACHKPMYRKVRRTSRGRAAAVELRWGVACRDACSHPLSGTRPRGEGGGVVISYTGAQTDHGAPVGNSVATERVADQRSARVPVLRSVRGTCVYS